MRRALAAVGVLAALCLAGLGLGAALALAPAVAAKPAPTGIPLLQPVRAVDPLQGAVHLGLRKDRLLKSVVPGPVTNTEQLTVAVGPSGARAVVTDLQQLVITAAGNYIVRELGPARRAEGLGDTVPPVLELGQVVWQGFSPGRRTLQARLTLDPAIEAHRLPMSVRLTFRDRSGRVRVLGAGSRAPADGTVSVTITNATGSPRTLALGAGDAGPLAAELDRLYAAAAAPRAAVPPYAGGGLGLSVPGSYRGDEQITVSSPLRVTGSIGATPGTAQVRGPGTTATAAGAEVAGTLDGTASFDVDATPGQRLTLDLDVRPCLAPRTPLPPAPTCPPWPRAPPDTA